MCWRRVVNGNKLLATGFPENSIITIVISILVFILSVLLGIQLPEKIPSMVILLPVLLAMLMVMNALQGSALALHVKQQGKMESGWKTLGIGLLFMVVLFLVFYVFAVFFEEIILTI